MGESAFLMHAFSYASGISNEANQGNPIHALGESISFGRFITESLAWEKWSTFSQKCYVEEAGRYAQPGSVAQKKAFFEAHYKRIAAKKAAALLEQANAAHNNPEPDVGGRVCNNTTHDSQITVLTSQAAVDEQHIKTEETREDFIVNADGYNSKHKALVKNPTSDESLNQLENVEDSNMVSGMELSETPQMEKPLLKQSPNSKQDVSCLTNNKKPILSSLKSSVSSKASQAPSSPAKPVVSIHPRKQNSVTPTTKMSAQDSTDKKRSTPKTLCMLVNFTPSKRPDKLTTPAIQKIESSRVAPSSFKANEDCTTPPRTLTTASVNGVQKNPSATTCSENRSCSKASKACSKKVVSPSLSAPFILRTEERAARRKQKLDEKFLDKEAQKVQLQTKFQEKAETELRKLRHSLCFKARPLPDFYREKINSKKSDKEDSMDVSSVTQTIKKAHSQNNANHVLTASSNVFSQEQCIQEYLEKNNRPPTHSLSSLQEMITCETTSPNIQH